MIKNSIIFSNSRIKYWFLIVVIQFLAPALLVIGAEIIQKGSMHEVQLWISTNPYAFLLNYGIAFFFLMFIWSLIENVYLSFGTYFFIGFFLVLLNVYKMKFLKEPIFPWDIFLYNQVINLFPHIYKETNILIYVFLLALLVLMILMAKWLPPLPLNRIYRIFGGVISFVLLLSLMFYYSTPLLPFFKKLNIRNAVWDQTNNYKTNGLFLSFFLNMNSAIVLPPKGYGEDQILNILNNVAKADNSQIAQKTSTVPRKKPNVIFLMSESFSDPTLLKNISFSSDPLPTFHSLLKNGKASWMLTPQYGGGTANVEFEVLTGFNMSFLPSGSIPYQQYVNHPIPSLVSAFAKEGYNTFAIHPYNKTFWNRDRVYKNLGFQQFISLEQFNNPKKSGGYFVDDREVTQSIIHQTENSDKPAFIYAVTIQNHGTYHYSDHSYPYYPIKVDGKLSKESKETLNVYSNGLTDGDRQIQDLISYYKKSNEPTILVLFGDHLPNLGVYNETEFITQNKVKNMKTTPLVIWTNYGKQPKNLFNTVSSSYLGTYVFELAGMKPPLFFEFLENFRNVLPGYNPMLKINSSGNIIEKTPESLKKLEYQYQLLQYDFLFGKQYANKLNQ